MYWPFNGGEELQRGFEVSGAVEVNCVQVSSSPVCELGLLLNPIPK